MAFPAGHARHYIYTERIVSFLNLKLKLMLYKRIYNGHEILFWPVSSIGNIWLASENFLFVDGKLIAKSGGLFLIVVPWEFFVMGTKKSFWK